MPGHDVRVGPTNVNTWSALTVHNGEYDRGAEAVDVIEEILLEGLAMTASR